MAWDKVGAGLAAAFVTGDVAAVKAATDAGAAAAGRIGEVVSVQVIPRPHEDLHIVLPETSKKDNNQVAGRTENMRWVNFDADPSCIGGFVDVIITEALPNSLRGRLVDSAAAA